MPSPRTATVAVARTTGLTARRLPVKRATAPGSGSRSMRAAISTKHHPAADPDHRGEDVQEEEPVVKPLSGNDAHTDNSLGSPSQEGTRGSAGDGPPSCRP